MKSLARQRQVDKNHDVYTDEQLEELLEHVFKHTDLNNDGYISYLEYRVNDHGKIVESEVKYGDKDLEEIVNGALKQADRNNDGYIDYFEYKSV
ncbi:hypothetical protein RR46_07048 [Papilio xuthus]|uniref:EF-hand domain-containing protein n=1 Tax=Papilio xuthus TaxID=66420 RepID=A0A194Q4J3_PAPXU|nr:hypothetical protein RR46_07048 [Papilio xuthus]